MYDPGIDSRQFQQFIDQRLTGDDTELSPEDLLDEYRMIHPVEDDESDDLAAVQEALDDIAAGDLGTPLEEFELNFGNVTVCLEIHELPLTNSLSRES